MFIHPDIPPDDLFHRILMNYIKRFKLCIENWGNHVENIISQHQN